MAPLAAEEVDSAKGEEAGVIEDEGLLLRGKGPRGGDVRQAMRENRVVDWEAMEAAWERALYEHLGWQEGEEGVVLLSEPIFTARADRERAACAMFEGFNVQGLFVAEQPLLSSHAANKTTSLSVDFGSDCVDVCPVIEGRAIQSSARRLRHGGMASTQRLASRLGLSLSDAEVAKVRASLHAPPLDGLRNSLDPAPVHIPGRQEPLEVPGEARVEAGEVAVGPDTGPRPSEEAATAIMWSQAEYRQALAENVVVSGGGAGVDGLAERVVEEVGRLGGISGAKAIQGHEHMPAGWQQSASWLGGAILAKVVFSQNLHCTRFDYLEQGPNCVWPRS